jgi:hypothetical protein
MGVEVQSLFCKHAEQCCSCVQNGAGAAQSAFVVHVTHSALATSQILLSPEQSALDVQPPRQRRFPESQMGVDPPQSALERHCTQAPVARQMGALAAQSELVRQATQLPSVALQRAAGAAQSLFCRHCAQAPVAGSHLVVLRGQGVALVPVHEAWHW